MKSIYVSNPGFRKIGDTVICEPALYEYGKQNDAKIYFNVCFDLEHDQLFENHPYIIPIRDLPFPNHRLDSGDAFQFGHKYLCPFGAGFFEQLEMSYHGKRLHYTYWSDFSPRNKTEEFWSNTFRDSVLIIPNGHSCTSRTMAGRPNVQPGRDFWKPIIDALPGKIFALSGKMDYEEFPFLQTFRDLTMRQLLIAMKSASLMISVETGPLHLASATKTPSIFLSSATPEIFSKPNCDCEVVRADYADSFDQGLVIQAALRLLERNRAN